MVIENTAGQGSNLGNRFEQISEMIKYNYHLHNVIKTNLLENLKNYSGEDYLWLNEEKDDNTNCCNW